jgi:predicted DNA-binding protein with PD1-like motif
MKAKLINDDAQKTFALVFDKNDEVVDGLLAFAKQNNLQASHFTAIGAFRRTRIGFFDRAKKAYKEIPLEEQVEVLSLIGAVTLGDGEPKLHAHVVVGREDGTTRGGHLLQGQMWPTLEVVLTESPRYLRRRVDDETGVPLIDISATE